MMRLVILIWTTFSCFGDVSSAIINNDIGYFWQITDIHFDSNYSQHGNPKKYCWDITQPGVPPLGEFGNHACDAPWTLVTSAVKTMKRLHPNPDFIVMTGDSIAHIPDAYLNSDKILTILGNVTDLILGTFPNVKVYPSLGNHDWYPAHQYPGGSSPFYGKILNVSHWQKMLTPEAAQTFKNGGFYTTMMAPGIRLVSINSNMWYFRDKKTVNMTDPAHQLVWLETVLAQSRKNSEKVFLIGHIPPGFQAKIEISFFSDVVNKHVLQILTEYSDIISSMLFGHEHTDGFHVIYKKNKPVAVTLMAPAVTPWNYINNPSIRFFQYRKSTGQVLDIHQYFLNLTAANAHRKADWLKLYQASQTYGIPDISPESMHGVVSSFSNTASQNFEKYFLYSSAGYDTGEKCNQTCRHRHMCSIQNVDYDAYRLCVKRSKVNSAGLASLQSEIVVVDSDLDNADDLDDSDDLGKGHHHRGKWPVPRFMHWVIIGLVILVIVLFIALTVVCLCWRGRTTMVYRGYVVLE